MSPWPPCPDPPWPIIIRPIMKMQATMTRAPTTLYLGYAREDRSELWLRLPDEADVPKALRVLADHHYLHTRYYGSEQQTDFHLS
jgi:hypothetical protein